MSSFFKTTGLTTTHKNKIPEVVFLDSRRSHLFCWIYSSKITLSRSPEKKEKIACFPYNPAPRKHAQHRDIDQRKKHKIKEKKSPQKYTINSFFCLPFLSLFRPFRFESEHLRVK